MDVHEILRIDRIQGGSQVGAGATETPRGASFAELLEQLGELAKSPTEPVSPTPELGELNDALRRADETFMTAMDLRHQLEAAFRKHQS